MKKLTVLLVCILLAAPAMAQVIFGGSDCGQWVRSPSEARRSWLLGYMAGQSSVLVASWGGGVEGDPPNFARSADQIYLSIDNFCRANPLRNVDDGASELSSTLGRDWILDVLRATARTTPTASPEPAFGASDCGQWIRSPTELQKAWLLGYMSGGNRLINRSSADRSAPLDPKEVIDPLAAVSSADQIFLWMDNYCRANPLRRLSKGANALTGELLGQAIKRQQK